MQFIKKYPWLLLLIGILLGIILLSAFNYFKNNKSSNQEPEQVTQPVDFLIGPHNHLRGDYDAPVTLVVFNDFTCPYCQDYALNLENLMLDYNDQVRLVWKHFPLNSNELSPAIASECADQQAEFWSYAHRLYTHTGSFDNQFYLSTAADLDLDQTQFSDCLESDKYEAKIKADYYEGIIKGVIGAPATFINGEYIPGLIPLDRLKEIIDSLLS